MAASTGIRRSSDDAMAVLFGTPSKRVSAWAVEDATSTRYVVMVCGVAAPAGSQVYNGVRFDSSGRLCVTTVASEVTMYQGIARRNDGALFVTFEPPGATSKMVRADFGSLLVNSAGAIHINGAAADFRFAAARSLVSQAFDGTTLTLTRASSQTYFDSTGSLQTAATDAAAYSYDPTSTPLNAFNLIPNNTMAGASAPSTIPTGWLAGGAAGTTKSIVGVGTEDGITYIDIRWVGTTNATTITQPMSAITETAALPGEAMTHSFYQRLVGGSLTNVTATRTTLAWYDSGSVSLSTDVGTHTPTSASLASQRVSLTATSPASTAYVQSQLRLTVTNGAAIDITIRIGLPQLERSSSANAVMETSGTAGGTRSTVNTTLTSRGLSMWEARTNGIRNSVAAGATVGTIGSGGALPTNWAVNLSTTGLSADVVETGTENGIAYVDLRIYGTATATANVTVTFDTTLSNAALDTEIWTASVYARTVSGSLPATSSLKFQFYNAVPASVQTVTSVIDTMTSTGLSTQRWTTTGTAADATIAWVRSFIQLPITNTVAYDFTVRIGGIQLEKSSSAAGFASPLIETSGAAATRALPACSTTNVTWASATEGTLVTEAIYASLDSTAKVAAALYVSGDHIGNTGVSSAARFRVLDTTNQAVIDVAASANTTVKQASAYKANDFAAAVGGTLGTPDVSGTIPAYTGFAVGSRNGAGTDPLNGYLARATYYSLKLPDATLQSLST